MNERIEQPESEPENPLGDKVEIPTVQASSSSEVESDPVDTGVEPQTTDDPLRVELAAGNGAADVATAESTLTSEIRLGSPFAVDPAIAAANRPIEPFYDVGPMRYTAMGAVAASVMVMGFAIAAAWWFPSGGALVAALGCVLSIFGMYSAFRGTAVGLLAIHLVLFVLSYGRSIG